LRATAPCADTAPSGAGVGGAWAPLMHLDQARFDQIKAGEEAGYLLPGAQRLRRGDPLVVDPLRAGLGEVDVDRRMGDRQVAGGRQRRHQAGHDGPRVLGILDEVQHPEQHERHRLAEVEHA
jgi:hypothetical protein